MNETLRILRDLPLHAEPRRLQREAAPAVAPAMAHAPQPVSPAPQALMDDEAHASAYAEGYRAGQEAARAEAAQQVAEQSSATRASLRAQEAQLAAAQQAQAEAARGAEQTDQQRALLARLIETWPAERKAALADAEEDMVALAFELTCKLLGEQAATVEGLRAQLQQALRAWHGRAALAIHLHPQDLALLQNDAASLELLRGAGFSGHRHTLRWMADPAVQLGGLMLRSTEGLLDARLEVQLDALKNVLAATRSGRKHAVAPAPRKDAS